MLAPYVPQALLARLGPAPIEGLTETVQCTMVFADVSGFTTLSERLARRWTEGAEQLVDVINACFSALLAEADSRGGSLMKFGGDAMLLLFYDEEPGQEHAPQPRPTRPIPATLLSVPTVAAGVARRYSEGARISPRTPAACRDCSREQAPSGLGPPTAQLIGTEAPASAKDSDVRPARRSRRAGLAPVRRWS
jgi:class 3 adenylate cyclase